MTKNMMDEIQEKLLKDIAEGKLSVGVLLIQMFVHIQTQSAMLASIHNMLAELYDDLDFIIDQDDGKKPH